MLILISYPLAAMMLSRCYRCSSMPPPTGSEIISISGGTDAKNGLPPAQG